MKDVKFMEPGKIRGTLIEHVYHVCWVLVHNRDLESDNFAYLHDGMQVIERENPKYFRDAMVKYDFVKVRGARGRYYGAASHD